MSTHVPSRQADTSASEQTLLGKSLMDGEGLARTLARIAHEIIERNDELESVVLVGIQTRGVPIAERLAELIEGQSGVEVALGAVDITFHRDDRAGSGVRSGAMPGEGRGNDAGQPVVHATDLEFPLAGATCVLVDDVLYTGRTIRAAIETLFAHGRPARVQLAVLVDRGHRELPIRPDYVGKNLPTSRSERIQVQLDETDGIDRILLVDVAEEASRE